LQVFEIYRIMVACECECDELTEAILETAEVGFGWIAKSVQQVCKDRRTVRNLSRNFDEAA
jgi:hypothetical protein